MKEVIVTFESSPNEIGAAYFRIKDAAQKSERTEEIVPGNVYADYDVGGNLIGVEVLGPFDVLTLAKLLVEA